MCNKLCTNVKVLFVLLGRTFMWVVASGPRRLMNWFRNVKLRIRRVVNRKEHIFVLVFSGIFGSSYVLKVGWYAKNKSATFFKSWGVTSNSREIHVCAPEPAVTRQLQQFRQRGGLDV